MAISEEAPSLLLEAIEAKARETGTRYTYRDLAEASNTHFTTIDKFVRGERRASANVIKAWGKALAPHLNVDEALYALGHKPDNPMNVRAIREAAERSYIVGQPNSEAALNAIVARSNALITDRYPVQESAHAGDDASTESAFSYIPPERVREGRFVSIDVRGNCMVPAAHHGEVAIVHVDGRANDGDMVAALTLAGEMVIRTLDSKRDQLTANDGSSPIPLANVAAVVPVVGVYRPMRYMPSAPDPARTKSGRFPAFKPGEARKLPFGQ